MDVTDDASNEGRVTRARRKRLVSIDSEVSSRPGTPMSPQRALRSNIKNDSDALPKRITRRNSVTNTPQKTPSKIPDFEFADVDTPSIRTRRRTVSVHDENTPQKLSKQKQLTVLPEEDIQTRQNDKKKPKTGKTEKTEKTSKSGKPQSPPENVKFSLKPTRGRKRIVQLENDDSDIEVINLDEGSNDSCVLLENSAFKSDKIDKKSVSEIETSKNDTGNDSSNALDEVFSQTPSKPQTTPAADVSEIKIDTKNGEKEAIFCTPNTSAATDEQKSMQSKSVTFESSNVLEESKTTFPKTPSVVKRGGSLLASSANKRILQLSNSALEDDVDVDNENENESSSITEENTEKNTPQQDKVEDVESRCSTPNVLQANTIQLSNTPIPVSEDNEIEMDNIENDVKTQESPKKRKSKEADSISPTSNENTFENNISESKQVESVEKNVQKKPNDVDDDIELPESTTETVEPKQKDSEPHDFEILSKLDETTKDSNAMVIDESVFEVTSNANDSVTDAMEKSNHSVDSPAKSNENDESKIVSSSFAKSWAQSVQKSSSKIDMISTANHKSPNGTEEEVDEEKKSLKKNISESSFDCKLKLQENSTVDEDEDEDNENEHENETDRELRSFLNNEAKSMGRDYESLDSMDEEEKQDYAENDLENDDGESIGSVDTSEDDAEDESADEKNSFIVPTDEESDDVLLEYSDEDEHLNEKSNTSRVEIKKKVFKRIKKISTDTEDEKALDFEVTHMIDDTTTFEDSGNPDADESVQFIKTEKHDNMNKSAVESEVNKSQRRSKNASLSELNEGDTEKRRRSHNKSLIGETNVEKEAERLDNLSLVESNETEYVVAESTVSNPASPTKKRRSQTYMSIDEKNDAPTKTRQSRNMSFNANDGKKLETGEPNTGSPEKSRRLSKNISLNESNAEEQEDFAENTEASIKTCRSRNASLIESTDVVVMETENAEVSMNKGRSRNKSLLEINDEHNSEKNESIVTPKERRRSRNISMAENNNINSEAVESMDTVQSTTKQRRSQNTSLMGSNDAEIEQQQSKGSPAISRRSVNTSHFSEDESDNKKQEITVASEKNRRSSRNICLNESDVVEQEVQKNLSANIIEKNTKHRRSGNTTLMKDNDDSNVETQNTVDTSVNQRRSRNLSLMEDNNSSHIETKERRHSRNASLISNSLLADGNASIKADENDAQSTKSRRSRTAPLTNPSSSNLKGAEKTTVQLPVTRRSQNISLLEVDFDESTQKPESSHNLSVSQSKRDDVDTAENEVNHTEKQHRARKMSSMENTSLHLRNDDFMSEQPCTSRKIQQTENEEYKVSNEEGTHSENKNNTDDLSGPINNRVSSPNKADKRCSLNQSMNSNVEVIKKKADKLATIKRQRSKSFIETGNEQKPSMEHKKPKLSISFNLTKQDRVVSFDSNHSEGDTIDGKNIKIRSENTSTPFTNKKGQISSSDQKDIFKILQRCNEILEESIKSKTISKEHKPTKEKKKKTKSKVTSENIGDAPTVDDYVKQAALQRAIQASQNILSKPAKKRQREKLELQNDENKYASKRLPVDILTAVSSSSDGDSPNKPKKRKKDNSPGKQKPVVRNVFKSICGDIVVESPIPMPQPKKSKIHVMKTSTGDVRVEPVTPLRKKVNNIGFRESPITPRVAGWKMRELHKLNSQQHNTHLTGVEKKRKRRIAEMIEPTNTLSQPTWTKSAGTFKIDKLEEHRLVNGYGHAVNKKSHRQTSAATGSSAAERAMNFRETALYRETIPREDARNLLRRKRFLH